MERKENQSRQESSQQYLTDLAYFNFVRLAQTYGRDPSRKKDAIDPELSPLLNENTRTLGVNIPSDLSLQGHPDYISGIDYGSNVVEVFYRKGESGAKVYLKKDRKTGTVKMHTISVFKIIHREEGYHTLERADGSKIRPDISTLTELLEKAEKVLEEKEREKLAARFDKKKPTMREKLARRIGNF